MPKVLLVLPPKQGLRLHARSLPRHAGKGWFGTGPSCRAQVAESPDGRSCPQNRRYAGVQICAEQRQTGPGAEAAVVLQVFALGGLVGRLPLGTDHGILRGLSPPGQLQCKLAGQVSRMRPTRYRIL